MECQTIIKMVLQLLVLNTNEEAIKACKFLIHTQIEHKIGSI
jgi:hypothetical protein